MSDPTNFRQERIEKLLHELRYEVERGILEHDIDETLTFRFYVPLSHAIPDGVVFCEFHTRPMLWRQGRGLGGPLRTGSFAPADQRRDVLATEIVQNRLMLRRMPVRARFCSPRSP